MTATGLLRERSQGGEARVETVELFYDLVFVFAITQLSHRLVHHPTIHGAIETGILFVAIWSSWVNTAWVTNWLDPNRRRVRFMLFALMAGGLVVSMSIPDAFAEKAVPFAIAYVAVELGRSAFTALALRRHDHGNYLNFIRILAWQALSGALWIAGAFDAEARLWLWAGAMALWTAGPAAFFFVPGLGRSSPEDWNVEAHHFAERCGLFIIIAFGESILATGDSFAEIEWTRPPAIAFLASFVGTVALWWTYFDIGAERATETFSHRDRRGRGQVARLAYTYLHIAIVGGIVGARVGKVGIPPEWQAGLLEWPRTVVWMERLGARLAAVMASGEPQRPLPLSAPALLVRNLFFLLVVLYHGLRRLLPPY